MITREEELLVKDQQVILIEPNLKKNRKLLKRKIQNFNLTRMYFSHVNVRLLHNVMQVMIQLMQYLQQMKKVHLQ